MPEAVRTYLEQLGKATGALGGAARAKAMTPKERRDAAIQAVKARWSRKTKQQRQAAARKLARARWAKQSAR